MKRKLHGLVTRGVGKAAPQADTAIEKIMLSSAGFARQPTEAQVDALAADVTAATKALLETAMSGNVHAIRRVTEVTSNLCTELMLIACMHQEAANDVARERTAWPLTISNDPRERRRTLRLVTGPRKLPLGGGAAPERVATRPASFAAPANAAVLMALKAIQIERAFRVPTELFPVLQPEWSSAAAQLPDLDGTSSVADRWFEVIWLYIVHRHGGTPENSALRKLGEPAAPRKAASASHETALRARIRQALRHAFNRMVKRRGRKLKD